MAVFTYLPPSPVFAVFNQFEGEVVSSDFVGKRHTCLLLWKLQEKALIWLLTTSQSPQRGSARCVYGLPSVRLLAAICAAARHSTVYCRCRCHHKARELFGERRGSRGFVVQQLWSPGGLSKRCAKSFWRLSYAASQHPFDFLMPLWVGIAHNPPVCPQKPPFMWMSCRKSEVCP